MCVCVCVAAQSTINSCQVVRFFGCQSQKGRPVDDVQIWPPLPSPINYMQMQINLHELKQRQQQQQQQQKQHQKNKMHCRLFLFCSLVFNCLQNLCKLNPKLFRTETQRIRDPLKKAIEIYN